MDVASAFLFGKLPAHGDFVCRGLGPAAQEAWDACASDLLARLRELHGEAFDEVHQSVPPWRFLLGPGGFGEDWRAGAIAPSIDSVGRRFVLVVGVQGLSPARACGFGLAAAQGAEEIIYAALGAGWSADAVAEAATGMAAELQDACGPAADLLGGSAAAATLWWRPGQAALVEQAGPPAELLLVPEPAPQ